MLPGWRVLRDMLERKVSRSTSKGGWEMRVQQQQQLQFFFSLDGKITMIRGQVTGSPELLATLMYPLVGHCRKVESLAGQEIQS